LSSVKSFFGGDKGSLTVPA